MFHLAAQSYPRVSFDSPLETLEPNVLGTCRLLECLRLRVKDIDFGYRQITVRDGKGMHERVTVLPERLRRPLRDRIDTLRLGNGVLRDRIPIRA